MFHGIVVDSPTPGQTQASLRELDTHALPPADVDIDVHYSTLNYKDALAITGRAPVLRQFPMVPGIDLAGIVRASRDPRFQPGDAVFLNGWGAGERHWGGLAQQARVPGDWLLPVPPTLSLHQVAAIGTAGYTAMLCVLALERHGLTPAAGEVLVTGASGGVGSIAVSLLARQGYRVTAVTREPARSRDYLMMLGATDILPRRDFQHVGKPLERARWAGAIDVAGGRTLANVCAGMAYRGVIAACGLADDMSLPASMAPFILRGVALLGIDSVMCPLPERQQAWTRLARDLDRQQLARMSTTIGLADVIPAASQLLDGAVQGRLVVDMTRHARASH